MFQRFHESGNPAEATNGRKSVPIPREEPPDVYGGVDVWVTDKSARLQARTIVLLMAATGAAGSTWSSTENALFVLMLYGYLTLVPTYQVRLRTILTTLVDLAETPWLFSSHRWTRWISVPRAGDLAAMREVWREWIANMNAPLEAIWLARLESVGLSPEKLIAESDETLDRLAVLCKLNLLDPPLSRDEEMLFYTTGGAMLPPHIPERFTGVRARRLRPVRVCALWAAAVHGLGV